MELCQQKKIVFISRKQHLKESFQRLLRNQHPKITSWVHFAPQFFLAWRSGCKATGRHQGGQILHTQESDHQNLGMQVWQSRVCHSQWHTSAEWTKPYEGFTWNTFPRHKNEQMQCLFSTPTPPPPHTVCEMFPYSDYWITRAMGENKWFAEGGSYQEAKLMATVKATQSRETASNGI